MPAKAGRDRRFAAERRENTKIAHNNMQTCEARWGSAAAVRAPPPSPPLKGGEQ